MGKGKFLIGCIPGAAAAALHSECILSTAVNLQDAEARQITSLLNPDTVSLVFLKPQCHISIPYAPDHDTALKSYDLSGRQ